MQQQRAHKMLKSISNESANGMTATLCTFFFYRIGSDKKYHCSVYAGAECNSTSSFTITYSITHALAYRNGYRIIFFLPRKYLCISMLCVTLMRFLVNVKRIIVERHTTFIIHTHLRTHTAAISIPISNFK